MALENIVYKIRKRLVSIEHVISDHIIALYRYRLTSTMTSKAGPFVVSTTRTDKGVQITIEKEDEESHGE